MENLSQTINILADALGENSVLTLAAIGADYCHDETPDARQYAPDAVCLARSTEDVAAVLRVCNEAGVPVTVRGAGTGQAGGSVPIKGGVVIAMGGMNKILGYDEAAGLLTVQPGALLQDVKAEAERLGRYYPPDPGEKTSTIGGNAATDAAGPCAVKYGSTKDYIADAVVVLPDGTVAKLSDKSEYAAVIGSEGALGVITELTLKLAEKPAASVILLFPFADTETALAAAPKIMASEQADSVSVLEYMDTDVVEFSGNVSGNPMFPVEMEGDHVAATLMVTLEGEDGDELDGKMEALAELAEELECLDILVVDSPTMKREAWAAYDAFHTSMESGAKCACEVNVDLPPEKVGKFVEDVKALAVEKGLRPLIYAHAASGGVHVHAVSDDTKEAFIPLADGFAAAVYAKCAEIGGSIAGEYGVGYAKAEYFRTLCPDEYAGFAALKAAFDPKGILNPGKVVG